MIHVVYLDNSGKKGERELDKIISLRKTMVIRSAKGRKIPHSRVFQNDKIYFMEKGSGLISAKANVINVSNYVKLEENEINKILESNQEKLLLTGKQKERWFNPCMCLVEFNSLELINTPLKFIKQSNMDNW